MKKLLLITLFFYSLYCSAQKTKTIQVVSTQLVTITGLITYDENNTPLDTTYSAMARNHKYQYLTDYIFLRVGVEISEIYNLFIYAKEFLTKEDHGVSENYGGNRIHVYKSMGAKSLWIHGIDQDKDGYCGFVMMNFNNIISKLESWATKNKVSLK